MHAVILAGGKGTRLRPYTTRLPKPLVPIGDEHSILEIALIQLAQCGFGQVTLAIGHFGELIRSYIGDGSRWGVGIDYTSPEEVPLGTMGPVLRILDQLPDEFLVMNGDVLTDLDYADLMCRHRSPVPPLTVATYQREVQINYGVLTTRDGQVLEFTEKPTFGYRVSMGIYACSKRALLQLHAWHAVRVRRTGAGPAGPGHQAPSEYAFKGTGSTSAGRRTTTAPTPSSA